MAQQWGRTSTKLSLGSFSLVLPAADVSEPCGQLWSLRHCCMHRYSSGMGQLWHGPLVVFVCFPWEVSFPCSLQAVL